MSNEENTTKFILRHYEQYGGKFECVDNANDYIDEIKKIGNYEVAFVNCSDWFKQYELAEYGLSDQIESDDGFYCPYTLLDNIVYYVNEFDDDRYEVFVLDNPCCTFVETINGYEQLCSYITEL